MEDKCYSIDECDSYTSTDFWDEIDDIVRKSELKRFNKQFKKIKKKLKKDVKDFQPWDYDYMLRFIEHSLEAMSLFLSNKYLVVQDTENINEEIGHNWKYSMTELNRCYELIKQRDETNKTKPGYLPTHECLKQAFRIMGKNITSWWD